MYEGSCLCGEVKYKITCEPEKVSHCHCTMCQKQHGAAFATYASFPKESLVYLSGQQLLSTYNSSSSVERQFCSRCGASLVWGGSPDYPTWVSVAIATFDTPYSPKDIIHIYTQTAACWLNHNFS